MSNYDMNTQQQQSQGYYPSEPQNGYGQPYGQQYSQPSYPPYEQYPTETNQYQNQAPGANADYYNGSSMSESGTDDEKGLGSTIVGGAAGGYAAHHFGGGKMGTLAGAALGAAGMNAATHAMKPKPQPQPQFVPVAAPAMNGYAAGPQYGMMNPALLGGGLGLTHRERKAIRRANKGGCCLKRRFM